MRDHGGRVGVFQKITNNPLFFKYFWLSPPPPRDVICLFSCIWPSWGSSHVSIPGQVNSGRRPWEFRVGVQSEDRPLGRHRCRMRHPFTAFVAMPIGESLCEIIGQVAYPGSPCVRRTRWHSILSKWGRRTAACHMRCARKRDFQKSLTSQSNQWFLFFCPFGK